MYTLVIPFATGFRLMRKSATSTPITVPHSTVAAEIHSVPHSPDRYTG